MLGVRMDHEMRIFVSNGAITHFTLRELLGLYRSWQLWLLVFVGFLIMSTGHPVTLPQFEGFGVRMAFWVIALVIYVAMSIPYGITVDWAWRKLVGKPIPLIILSAPLVLFSTTSTALGLVWIFEPGRPVAELMTWQMHVRNIFVAHVFETTALLWLIPAQRMRRAGHRSVTLAGRRLPIEEIGRVKAAEHYLEIHMPHGVEIIRERMSTFLEQVGPEDGVQTHRSHWIAREHARSLKGSVLELDCGKTVPVARGRQKEVQEWITRFPPPDIGADVALSPVRQSVSQ